MANIKAPKAPEDHKEKEIPFSQVEGHELLVPMDEIYAEDVIDLIAEVRELGFDTEAEKLKSSGQMVRLIRQRGFVADEEGFKKFATATNMGKTFDLISAYVGELGKEVA